MRMFPVLPATDLTAVTKGNTVSLKWEKSADSAVKEYYVYGASDRSGPYTRLAVLGNVGEWNHTNLGNTKYYMVRASKLEETGSGSFCNLAQGDYAEVDVYKITVNSGKADKPAAEEGETITVTAAAVPGKAFRKWTTEEEGVVFADAFSAVTSFRMLDKNVIVTAEYKDLHSITVNDGTTDKALAAEGETVTITSGEAPPGKVFDKWISGDELKFADANKAETTFTMIDKAVEVTAAYRDLVDYALTVVGGTAYISSDKVTEGKTVVIMADSESPVDAQTNASEIKSRLSSG